MKTKPSKFVYQIQRDAGCSREYQHIRIEIYPREAMAAWHADPLVVLTWQGDKDCAYWYGFHAETKCDHLYNAAEVYRTCASILGKLAETGVDADRPDAVLSALGFDRVVYDDRESRFLALSEVKPASFKRFMSWNKGCCEVCCVAEDMETAQKLLAKEFVEQESISKLEAWIADGKTTREDDYRNPPDIRPLEEILKPMKEPEIKTVEAELTTVS